MTRRHERVSFAYWPWPIPAAAIVLVAVAVFKAQSQSPLEPSGQSMATGSQSALNKTEENSWRNSSIQPDAPIYKYTGNLFSLKFHRPSCPFAKAMWRGHVIRFAYRKQAIDAGQKPCRYCLPPYWKSVGAKILNKQTDVQSDCPLEKAAPAEVSPPRSDCAETPLLQPGSKAEAIELEPVLSTRAAPGEDDKTSNVSPGASLPGSSP